MLGVPVQSTTLVQPQMNTQMLGSLGVAAPVQAEQIPADNQTDKTENEDADKLKLAIQLARVRRVLSDNVVNEEQARKIFAIQENIEKLPGHDLANKIAKNISEFKAKNKVPHPDSEKLRSEIADLRESDKKNDEFKKFKASIAEISETRYRFSAGVAIIAAVVAEETVRRNCQLAVLKTKNNKITVSNLLVGSDYMALDVWPLYRDGKNFNTVKTKFDNDEIKKLHASVLERAKRDFKGYKTEEELNEIASAIKVEPEHEDVHTDDDLPDGFLTHKHFMTYVTEICKSVISEHLKKLPEGAPMIKIENEFKVLLSYICIDTLEGLGRAIKAHSDGSKTKTLSSEEFQKIISIILNHANVENTKTLFKTIATTLGDYNAIVAARKAAAEKKAAESMTEVEKSLAEQKKKLAEEKKALVDKMKEESKQRLATVSEAEKKLELLKKQESERKKEAKKQSQ